MVIKRVARIAGVRSKVAVQSIYDEVDPLGTCIGKNSERIQSVLNLLEGEAIDLIRWREEPIPFIREALKPAQVVSVTIEENKAKVEVIPSQKTLAIGKNGDNVRLAAKLTGYSIDIYSGTE